MVEAPLVRPPVPRCRRCGGSILSFPSYDGDGPEVRCLLCGRPPAAVNEEFDSMKVAGTVGALPPVAGRRSRWSGEAPRIVQELGRLQGSNWLDLECGDLEEAHRAAVWLKGKLWRPWRLEVVARAGHVYIRPALNGHGAR